MGIGSNKRQKRQFGYDKELQQRGAELSYEYGELAAEEAYRRQREMYEIQKEDTSYKAQVQDAEEAGLSFGLLYGGGGGGGSASGGKAAQGGATLGGAATEVSPYAEAELGLQLGQLGAEIKRVKSEAKLNKQEINESKARERLTAAEERKTDAETLSTIESTRTETESRELLIENLKQEGYGKWIENVTKDWNAKETSENGDSGIYDNEKFGTFAISPKNNINKKEAAEIAKIAAETAGIEAVKELNNAKKNALWEELIIATRNADANQQKAAAAKLAAEWSTGEFTNWKTWINIADDAIGAIGGLIQ